MRAALLIISILAIIVNILTTICSVGFLMACAPNSTPEQWLFLKRLMIGSGVIGGVCLIIAVILNFNRLPAWSIGVSMFPVLVAIVGFIWMYTREV